MRTDDILELTIPQVADLVCEEEDLMERKQFSGGGGKANRLAAEAAIEEKKTRDEKSVDFLMDWIR